MPASGDLEAGCIQRNVDSGTKNVPSMFLPALSKANSFRLQRSASVGSFANAQASVNGPPKKAAYRKKSMLPCQGPLGLRSSLTLDSSLSQSATFSRTRSIDSTPTSSRGAALKGPSQAVLKFQRAVAKAAHMKHFTKSIMSSVDSLQDQIRATYESCEKARDILARSGITESIVLSPLGSLDDQSLLGSRSLGDTFQRRVQESPGARVRHGSPSKPIQMMRRDDTGQLAIKSVSKTPSSSPRLSYCPLIQPAKSRFLGYNPDDSNTLVGFGSPTIRYLPGVGRRLVRTHKQRAVAMVVPNGLSVDPEQPDQHFAVSFSRELAACLEEFK